MKTLMRWLLLVPLAIALLGAYIRAESAAPPLRVPDGVKAHRDLAYVVNGHERQKLDLYLPEKAEGPLPLVIWVHGGGWQAGSKEQCQPLRSGFTDRGYAVASIGYRLSGDAIFPAQIEDCKAAVRWLRAHARQYGLDPDRFGVWGSSAGGHLVALLGTSGNAKQFDKGEHLDVSSRVQAVCDYFGPTDLLQMDAHALPGSPLKHDLPTSPESRLIGGAIQDNRQKAAKANPIPYVTKDAPPFLIVHGDQDPLVPHHQSELLFEALKQAGVDVRFHTVRGGGHGRGFGGQELSGIVEAFFERHLKGKPRADGAPKAIVSESAAMEYGEGTTRGKPETERAHARGKVVVKDFQLDGERWTCQMDGRLLSGILLKPDGKGPFPAVLISHGLGGSAQSFGLNKAREMVKWGLVCIAPNYTHNVRPGPRPVGGKSAEPGPRAGEGGKGAPGAPPRRDERPTDFGASEENIRRALACVEILRGLPEVDARRLAAYGHSMGGFVTVGLAAAEPGLLKAAAISGSGVAPRAGFPAPSAQSAERIRTPLLMLHGGSDPVVRPAQSELLKQVLDRNHVPNERHVFEGQGHPIDQSNRDEVFERIRAWCARHGVLRE